jgi:hypothetical protein
MKMWKPDLVAALFLLISVSGCALFRPPLIERNTFAELVFVSPKNNTEMQSPVTVVGRMIDMQLAGLDDKDAHNTHIHVLINSKIPPLNREMPHEAGRVIDIESGKVSIKLTLPPGTHKLQLIAADEWHRPHIPPLISEIRTIKVTE